ncbi:hypothetical protein ACJX0J_029324, partial [Zea mays]
MISTSKEIWDRVVCHGVWSHMHRCYSPITLLPNTPETGAIASGQPFHFNGITLTEIGDSDELLREIVEELIKSGCNLGTYNEYAMASSKIHLRVKELAEKAKMEIEECQNTKLENMFFQRVKIRFHRLSFPQHFHFTKLLLILTFSGLGHINTVMQDGLDEMFKNLNLESALILCYYNAHISEVKF